MVALVRPPKTLQEAYDVYGKDFVEGPGVMDIGRIADRYDQSGNLIEYGLRPITGTVETQSPPPRPKLIEDYFKSEFYDPRAIGGAVNVPVKLPTGEEYTFTSGAPLGGFQDYLESIGEMPAERIILSEKELMPMMPVYNRQPYSDISGIVNTNVSQDYLKSIDEMPAGIIRANEEGKTQSPPPLPKLIEDYFKSEFYDPMAIGTSVVIPVKLPTGEDYTFTGGAPFAGFQDYLESIGEMPAEEIRINEEGKELMPMMPVYNRQPYSDISGIVNTNVSQDYLEFLRSLGI